MTFLPGMIVVEEKIMKWVLGGNIMRFFIQLHHVMYGLIGDEKDNDDSNLFLNQEAEIFNQLWINFMKLIMTISTGLPICSMSKWLIWIHQNM